VGADIPGTPIAGADGVSRRVTEKTAT